MNPGDIVRVRGSRDDLVVKRVYPCEVHGTDIDCTDPDRKLRTFAADMLVTRSPSSRHKKPDSHDTPSGGPVARTGEVGEHKARARQLPPPTGSHL